MPLTNAFIAFAIQLSMRINEFVFDLPTLQLVQIIDSRKRKKQDMKIV